MQRFEVVKNLNEVESVDEFRVKNLSLWNLRFFVLWFVPPVSEAKSPTLESGRSTVSNTSGSTVDSEIEALEVTLRVTIG